MPPEETRQEIEKICKAHGEPSADALQSKGLGILTVDEAAMVGYALHERRDGAFVREYKPLLEEGVLRVVSLAEITEEGRLKAEAAGSPDAAVLNMTGPLAGYVSHYDRFKDLPRNEKGLFERAIQDMDYDLSGFLLAKTIRETQPEILQETSESRKGEFFNEALLLEVFLQSLLTALLPWPTVSISDAHLILREKVVSQAMDRVAARQELDEKNATALKVFTETFRALPAILPRSPEALLEVRRTLNDELVAFREGAAAAAKELRYDRGSYEKISKEDIEYAVEQRLTKPLEDLNRRLAHPGSDLLRNLLTTHDVTAAGVTFTLTLTLAILAHNADATAVALSALAGLSTALLTEELRTSVGRKKDAEETYSDYPGVAFLVRAQEVVKKQPDARRSHAGSHRRRGR
jgi:hypothetical protein